MGDVIQLKPWKLYETAFCCFVADSKGKVTNIIFPDGQELNTENMTIIVHGNGIEFLEVTNDK